MQASGAIRREIAKSYQRHCERSEAIHSSACRTMDCFAALAPPILRACCEAFVTVKPDIANVYWTHPAQARHKGFETNCAKAGGERGRVLRCNKATPGAPC